MKLFHVINEACGVITLLTVFFAIICLRRNKSMKYHELALHYFIRYKVELV